jgi:hypothetical protein
MLSRIARARTALQLSVVAVPAALALTLTIACADAAATEPAASGDSPGAPVPGQVPGPVVGRWTSGRVSTLGFWNTQTGNYLGAANGLSILFAFEADGRYTMQVYVLLRNYGCVTEAWTELRGTVAFDGDTFATRPTAGRYKGTDSCVASKNFDRAATAAELADERRTHYWSFEPNATDGKTYLMIGRARESRSFFSRDP